MTEKDLEVFELAMCKKMKEKIKTAIENEELGDKECIEYIKQVVHGLDLFADIFE